MTEEIVLGGGCFWCTEAAFKEVEGTNSVTSGYAGGYTENPSYREVCSRDTGHAEVVKIEFNEKEVGLEEILELFFRIHDPTTKDREGPDIGSQYRSIILYQDEGEKVSVEAFINENQEDYEEKIVTEVKRLEDFYAAEEKHQDYFENNPEDTYCRMHARPKVGKAKEFSSKN